MFYRFAFHSNWAKSFFGLRFNFLGRHYTLIVGCLWWLFSNWVFFWIVEIWGYLSGILTKSSSTWSSPFSIVSPMPTPKVIWLIVITFLIWYLHWLCCYQVLRRHLNNHVKKWVFVSIEFTMSLFEDPSKKMYYFFTVEFG